MCYASNKDFGWGFRKETARTPEPRREDQDAGAETWTKSDDSEVKAFLDKSEVEEPASDRAP
ncbi:hypothetical protein SAMN04489742_1665 [Arthrobacter crystallopoietes]|uniref:Uncharacterized protein n=2 Tax=Crystallibacter crystallopoietes TaxID=37928 RepID=A0A1H1C041_9MICC|nr:hypothetical protein AC20117_09025 [Arthrobacter crystallopoietes]SDQ57538.1 hypothetical protein SAMN04489742_1665 [Arthrobacter crystallopoietes]